MEHTDLISLTEFARLHNLDPSTVRKKAERGNWKTAVKIGRNWLISKDEPHTDLRRNEIYDLSNQKGINMKLYYINDWMDETKAVVLVNDTAVKIWRNGIKTYKSTRGANAYLRSIVEGDSLLPPEPDEIIEAEEGEDIDSLADRTVGEMSGHVGYFERIYPKNPDDMLKTPKTFYKSFTTFMAQDVWYKSEAEAKEDADGIDTVYLGPVEVFDQDMIEEIEAEMATYEN